MYSPGGLTLIVADPFVTPHEALSVVNVAVYPPPPVCPTFTEPVTEHDVPMMVTVTVYVPAAFTTGVAVVPPETIFPPMLAIQLKETFEVEDEPAS